MLSLRLASLSLMENWVGLPAAGRSGSAIAAHKAPKEKNDRRNSRQQQQGKQNIKYPFPRARIKARWGHRRRS